MSQTECSGCRYRGRCEEVYRCLGASDAPPVAGKILGAFVLPLGVFLSALAGVGVLLEGHVGPFWKPLLSGGIALGVALGWVHLTKGRRR